MSGRRRRDGEAGGPRRVRGAWTTPAVVVRRPDGSVVSGHGRTGTGAEGGGPAREADGGGTPPRPRVRPRRIPGAPGSVLLAPTLVDTGGGAERRRLRRNSAAPGSVSPLPPRPPAAPPSEETGRMAAGDEQRGDGPARPARPPLAAVGAAIGRSGGAWAAHRLDLGRLLPDDPEARAERLARLRRGGVRLTAGVVAAVLVYTVFPVRMALDLSRAEDRARQREAVFERENEVLEDEVAELESDRRIEEEARALGMVRPGEESYRVMPAPEDGVPTTTSTVAPATSTTRPGG